MNDDDLDAIVKRYEAWADGKGTIHDVVMDLVAQVRHWKGEALRYKELESMRIK